MWTGARGYISWHFIKQFALVQREREKRKNWYTTISGEWNKKKHNCLPAIVCGRVFRVEKIPAHARAVIILQAVGRRFEKWASIGFSASFFFPFLFCWQKLFFTDAFFFSPLSLHSSERAWPPQGIFKNYCQHVAAYNCHTRTPHTWRHRGICH